MSKPVHVYSGKCHKLYLYSDLGQTDYHTKGFIIGWFPNVEAFRKETGARIGIRCAQEGIEAPKGYKKTGAGLANDPVEALPTLHSFVAALTPKKKR